MLEVSIHTVIDLQAQHQAAHLGPLYIQRSPSRPSVKLHLAEASMQITSRERSTGASDRSKSLNPSMTEETNVLGFQA